MNHPFRSLALRAPLLARARQHPLRHPLRHLHLNVRPARGAAAIRAWVRGHEAGVLLLAILTGVASGLVAVAMGGAARGLHALMFGPSSTNGLSVMRNVAPWLLVSAPLLGGLLLGLLNLGIARWRPRQPVDPIEANALHGGRMSLLDGLVVAAQNIVSNGFGASVGLEAGYTQAAGGVASRLGRQFGLRRGRRHRRGIRRAADRRLLRL